MTNTNPIPKTSRWISYILQSLIVLLFLMGATMNLLQTEEAIGGATELGYPESTVFYLGLILLLSTILYIIPRTAVLGAILLTAWLGGAVATHVIHSDPLFNTLFPVVFGILLWFALWLRMPKIKQLF